MRAIQAILGVVLVTGLSCSRDRPSTQTSVPPRASNTSPLVITPPSGTAPPVTSTQETTPESRDAAAAKLVEPYISQLRVAFIANDQKGFASLLTYPLLVHTASHCSAAIPDPATFVAHFDEIIGRPLAAALRSKTTDIFTNGHGTSFGNGSVWFDTYGKSKPELLCFNSDTWRIGNLPCAGEPGQSIPEWFEGTWYVTSVAYLQGGQMVSRSPTTWIGRRVDIDLHHKTASLRVDGENKQECTVDRFASRQSGQTRELTAAFAGLIRGDRTSFLDLVCHKAHKRYIARLEVINRTALALVGDDKYLLVLRQGTGTGKSTDGTPEKRSGCGSVRNICPKGQTCFASLDSNDELVEACAIIE